MVASKSAEVEKALAVVKILIFIELLIWFVIFGMNCTAHCDGTVFYVLSF